MSTTTLDEFGARLERAGGQLHRVADRRAAAAAIDGILRAHAAERVAFSDSAEVAAVGELLTGPAQVVANEPAALLHCDAGLSGAQWAIAETGTLVLDARSERHRLTSLLPPVHIALLRADRILPSLDEALMALRDPLTGLPGPAVTFITGPSRTADIELTLVVGVHGPRALHVIVFDDAADGR